MLEDRFGRVPSELEDLTVGEDSAKNMSERSRALALVNLSAGLDGCDDQMLPASFRALESELHFTPKMLGHISMVQCLTLSLSCPLWGYLADQTSRKLVLGMGCFMWGLATLLLSGADTFDDVVLLRAFNGCFMAVIGPVSQTVLADYTPGHARGFTFGMVQLTANAGRVIGGVLITSLGTHVFFGGISGWRFLIALLGIISMVMGGVILVFMPNPSRQRTASALTEREQDLIALTHRSGRQEGQSLFVFVKDVIQNSMARSTVVLIVLEGFVGCIPWNGMAFATMYYQYCGLSDLAAGLTCGCMLMGGMIGGPVGGLIGDTLSRRWSAGHARPLMAQISMAMRIPLLYVLFVVIPQILQRNAEAWTEERETLSGGDQSASVVTARTVPIAVFMLLSLGLGLSSFAGTAVNRPIMTEVVLPEHRATAFAIAIGIEGVCSAFFGAPLVGYLAEHRFGYMHTTKRVRDLDAAHRTQNAAALAKSMALITIIPWTVSFFIYTLVHFTYTEDLRSNRSLARARSLQRAGIPGLRENMRSGSVTRFLERYALG